MDTMRFSIQVAGGRKSTNKSVPNVVGPVGVDAEGLKGRHAGTLGGRCKPVDDSAWGLQARRR
jgi:hypothetical protein